MACHRLRTFRLPQFRLIDAPSRASAARNSSSSTADSVSATSATALASGAHSRDPLAHAGFTLLALVIIPSCAAMIAARRIGSATAFAAASSGLRACKAISGVILRSGVFAASRRMMFSSVLAAILRGSQELTPQDDVEIASRRR